MSHPAALTRLQAETRLQERAITEAMARLVQVRVASANDGAELIGEALSEGFQKLDRPLANLIHAGLSGHDEIDADNADLTAIGRLVWSVVTGYLRPMAEKRADAIRDEWAAEALLGDEDDAYERHKQDELDRRAA